MMAEALHRQVEAMKDLIREAERKGELRRAERIKKALRDSLPSRARPPVSASR